MKTDIIREKYLEFFESRGHKVCPSDVLVPKWDKTVLFTPAGMNPFKDHFLGNIELEFTRATSCQKCLRTGDIENVGRTAYHHTFFEMLGNFSFGDYFKKEAIAWAWEFLTDPRWLGLPQERLTVSVYLDDDEAAEIWQKDIGLSANRIQRLGEHDNFWPAGAPSEGPDGVCGPCSEIFYHPDEGPECEIWNLVFTQFRREGDPPDNLHPLPSKNIDTGMGLERIAAVLQGVETNFHIDSLRPIVEAAGEILGIPYEAGNEDGRRLRRIADHIRACTMAIHENVYPGANKEEYVVRRLLRRAVFQGHEMGCRQPALFQLVDAVVESMKRPYPELTETAERIKQVIRSDEESFLETLDEGLVRAEDIFISLRRHDSKVVPPHDAFFLYQTYGIPGELIDSLARQRGFEFDWSGFELELKKHQELSGGGPDGVMGNEGPLGELKQELKKTGFLGYETTSAEGIVAGLIESDESDGQRRVECLEFADNSSQIVVLDQTPFYAESGGQVGDTGTLRGPEGSFRVDDVKKEGDLFLHLGSMTDGKLSVGETIQPEVDIERRAGIQRAHSATHVLHHALQQNLGEHAQQRGSKVENDELRFDFSNLEPVPSPVLARIEKDANARVEEDAPIRAEILPLAEAKQKGAMMLFGEKYPDPVRMISMGEFSRELCGGTHLSRTSEIGAFEIVSESSVASGTRRIVAITGKKAQEHHRLMELIARQTGEAIETPPERLVEGVEQILKRTRSLRKQLDSGQVNRSAQTGDSPAPFPGDTSQLDYDVLRDQVRQVAHLLNVPVTDVVERVEQLVSDLSRLEQEVEALGDAPRVDADSLIETAESLGEIKLIVQKLPRSNPNAMRGLIDQIRKKTGPVAVFLATAPADDKVLLVAGLSRELVAKGLSAGDWVKRIAPLVGGGGGGKPDLAQAGGKQPEQLDAALREAADYLKSHAAH